MTPSRQESWAYAVGLALLYTSTFYLPYADSPHQYWLPNPTLEILYPSLIGTLLLIPIAWYVQRIYVEFTRRRPLALLGITIFGLSAFVSALSTAGYSASDIIVQSWANSSNKFADRRWIFAAIAALTCSALVTLLARIKHRLKWVRLLAILGYAYAIVAAIRITPSLINEYSLPQSNGTPIVQSFATSANVVRPREVIWIIFDELDYGETLGSRDPTSKTALPHLFALSRMGISASQAFPPARDTVVSLPSVLMAQTPIGYKIDRSAVYLHLKTGEFERFDQDHSVFARLPAGPASGALLGYYHPYCAFLPGVNPCVAMPMENVGRWFDALLPGSEKIAAALRQLPGSSALPGWVFHTLHPMYRITEETIEDYPAFLQLDNHSLIFLHVNLPHYPADYAQRALNLRSVTTVREGYTGNLSLVDGLVDNAMQTLQRLSRTRDILLIVTSDHWHRVNSPETAQTIPWIAWHVGDAPGPTLTKEMNTVHTAELALDFLRGNINSQQEIPDWWLHKSFAIPLMPEHYKD